MVENKILDPKLMKREDIIDEFTKKSDEVGVISKRLDALKAEIQLRGLKELEDKQLKTLQYWGTSNNYVLVQKTDSVDIVNYMAVSEVLRSVIGNFVAKESKVTYTIDKNLKDGIAAIIGDNYETRPVESILKEMGLNETQIDLCRRKLKGTWVKDKKFLESIGVNRDLELYLYFIHQSMNYEKLTNILMAAGYDKQSFAPMIAQLKKAFVVDSNTKISSGKK